MERRIEVCQRRRHALEVLPYDEFLNSFEWRLIAIAIRQRDESICQRCGLYARAGDVHHKTYEFGRICPAWALEYVCRSCHDIYHWRPWQGLGQKSNDLKENDE